MRAIFIRNILLIISVVCSYYTAVAQKIIPPKSDDVKEKLSLIESYINQNRISDAYRLSLYFDKEPDELWEMGFNRFESGSIYHIIGLFLSLEKEYSRSIPYFEKALSQYNVDNIYYDEDLASLYTRIIIAYCNTGDFDSALKYGEENLRKANQFKSQFSLESADAHYELFKIYQCIGNQAKEQYELEQIFQIIFEYDYIEMLNYFSYDTFFNSLIKYVESSLELNLVDDNIYNNGPAFEKDLEAYKPNSAMHLDLCNILFTIYYDKDRDIAVEFALKALDISNKMIKEGDMNLSIMDAINDYLFLATDYYKEDIDINIILDYLTYFKEQDLSNTIEFMTVLSNIAYYYGIYTIKGRLYLRDAYNILRNYPNLGLKTYLNVSCMWITSLWNAGKYEEMTSVIGDLNDYLSRRVIESFVALDENKRSLYWDQVKNWYKIMLPAIALSINNDDVNSLLYDALLHSRSILLSSKLALKELVDSSNDTNLKRLYSQLLEMGEFDDTDDIISALESRLLTESTQYGNFMNRFAVKRNQISQALRADEAAVEFIKFSPEEMADYMDMTMISPNLLSLLPNENVYYALIQKSNNQNPLLVKICNEKDLEDWTPESLYTHIWKPLESKLSNIKIIYFSPEGNLFSIPIECAVNENGQGVWESRDLYRVSSTREILNKTTRDADNEIVLFGGMKYDLPISGQNKVDHSIRIGGTEELPGSLKEVETIEEVIKKNGSIKPALYKDSLATVARFKSLSDKKSRIIHVATHGFYEDDTPQEFTGNINSPEKFTSKERSALQNSGLLFSGVDNVRFDDPVPPEVEDGVLDAYEVSNLDLHDTELVVLSACRTALGDVSSDGVFGLQRGFKKAGVDGILMSLWNVDDEATSYFMETFYRQLLSNPDKRDAKYAALKEARKAVMSKEEWKDYEYWAPFILLDAVPAH